MMFGGNKVVMMTVLPRRDKRDWTVGHSEMNTMMTLLIIVIIILIIVITSLILITIMRSTVYLVDLPGVDLCYNMEVRK